jgi:hypothetical protein
MKHTRTQALRKLESARNLIASLRDSSANSPRFQYWNEQTLRLILDLFPKDSTHESAYRALSFGLLFDPHHQPGSHQPEQTYQESLDKAETILTELLVALGAPGAVPPGASLVSEAADSEGPSDDVLVLHGPDEALMQRITPVIIAADRTRVTVTAWPEDPDVLARALSAREKPHAVLVLVGESDLNPPAQGTGNPPEVPKAVTHAIQAAVTAFGSALVQAVVQSKTPLKQEQVPVSMIRVDTRGYWRKALTRLLEHTAP